MGLCDLCSSPLDINGKRNHCLGCNRVLCISCNEMKTKLLFMTNGNECPCSILKDIDVQNKQEIPEFHELATNSSISSIPNNVDVSTHPLSVVTEGRDWITHENSGSSLKHGTNSNFAALIQDGSTKNRAEQQNILSNNENAEEKLDIRYKYSPSGLQGKDIGWEKDCLPPSNHTEISYMPESHSFEEFTNVFWHKNTTSYGVQTDENITNVNDGTSKFRQHGDPSDESTPAKPQDMVDSKRVQQDESFSSTNGNFQNLNNHNHQGKQEGQTGSVSATLSLRLPVNKLNAQPFSQSVTIPIRPESKKDNTDFPEFQPSKDLGKTTCDDSQVKGKDGALHDSVTYSSQEITPETDRKDPLSGKATSPLNRPRKKVSKHTCAGCGRRDCEGQFMKLMKAMTAAAKSNNFTIHNVVPDGNCMFAAVVDQLEINGAFSFSSKSLRQACVEHLRSNPESEDGTHYEMFMDNESWTQYLDRMSLEGQWGDHLMLQAVSQVTKRNIEVLHGGEKQEVTKINTILSKEDQKPLHLGHVGEFHYVSLREKQDDQDLLSSEEEEGTHYSMSHNDLSILEDPKKREMFVEDYIDPYCEIPSLHMSYLLKKMLPIGTVLNDADRCMHTCITLEYTGSDENPDSTAENSPQNAVTPKLIGDVIDGLYVHHMFWKENDEETEHQGMVNVPLLMICKWVTNIGNVQEDDQATQILCLKTDKSTHHGFTGLFTNNPSYWGIAAAQSRPVRMPKIMTFGDKDEFREIENDTSSKVSSYSILLRSKHVVAFHCRWPKEATEWITRKRKSNWPSDVVIDTIVTDGCHVIDQTHPKSLNPDSECAFCFGVAERTLCNEALTREQRYCLVVFLALCSQELREASTLISTDHLKAIFFYACEELPLMCWTSNLGSCMFYLLNSLVSHIEEKNIPCYFIPENNTIDHLSEDEIQIVSEKLNNLRWNPLQHIFSLVKDREFAWEIQQVITEDMDQFKITHNVRESVLNCFIPHAIKSARNSILRRRFKVAIDILQNAYEDRLTVATCDDQVPFQSFFNEAVQGIPLDCQWWFLLFSDEKLGMTMSSDLSLNLQPVTLSEIVDPSLVKDYASHLLPAAMALNKCQFITNFAWFLLTKYRTQQAIDNVMWCIVTYREKLELENNPQCAPEVLEKYFDFNERTIYKALVYLYYGLYRLRQEETFVYQFDVVKVVCEKLDCREVFSHACSIASTLNKEASNYLAQRFHACQNSDPSIVQELYLDTIITTEI